MTDWVKWVGKVREHSTCPSTDVALVSLNEVLNHQLEVMGPLSF